MKKLLILAAALALATPAMAANSLAVTGAAALEGNYGLAVNIDGSGGSTNNNMVYVVTEHPAGETTYRFSFIIDPNTFDIDASDKFRGIYIGNMQDETAGDKNFMFVRLVHQKDGWWGVQFNVRQDDHSFKDWSQTPIKLCHPTNPALPICSAISGIGVEIMYEWQAASAPGANDGFWRGYRNGNLARQLNNLDTDERTVERAWFGAIWMGGNDDGAYQANGTYYFDSFESFRTLAP